MGIALRAQTGGHYTGAERHHAERFKSIANSFERRGTAKVGTCRDDESGSVPTVSGGAATVVRTDAGRFEEKYCVVSAGDCRRSELRACLHGTRGQLHRIDWLRRGDTAEASAGAGG